MRDPIASILLVTWKRIDLLEDCVNGIAAAKPTVPFELVIVSHGEPVHDRAAFERALELPPWPAD